MSKKCCLTCGNRYHMEFERVCCRHNPGCGVKPNQSGIYIFSTEQAKESTCESYYGEFGDRRFSIMDYETWIDAYHNELKVLLRRQYDEYVEMMMHNGKTDEAYIVSFKYDDVGGKVGEACLNYRDREQAIRAAVRESKRPGNYGVQLWHEWHDMIFNRTEGEWIDWEKESGKQC